MTTIGEGFAFFCWARRWYGPTGGELEFSFARWHEMQLQHDLWSSA